jgi:hypothetical protein
MRRMLIAIAAAAALLPAGARAKPHHQITDAERGDCLTTDNDPDGIEWCVKFGKGMTQAQIDAWYVEEGKRLQASVEATAKKAAVELKDAADGAEARQKAFNARLHHVKNEEIMKQCNQMADTPGIDWKEVATLRGITVSLNDCANAAAGLAAEYEK